MSDHLVQLKRARMEANLMRNRPLWNALTAAIEALEARDAAPTRMSTEELRDACEQAALELWGEEYGFSSTHGTLVAVGADGFDGGVAIDVVTSERDALEQLLPALLVRLVQRGDR